MRRTGLLCTIFVASILGCGVEGEEEGRSRGASTGDPLQLFPCEIPDRFTEWTCLAELFPGSTPEDYYPASHHRTIYLDEALRATRVVLFDQQTERTTVLQRFYAGDGDRPVAAIREIRATGEVLERTYFVTLRDGDDSERVREYQSCPWQGVPMTVLLEQMVRQLDPATGVPVMPYLREFSYGFSRGSLSFGSLNFVGIYGAPIPNCHDGTCAESVDETTFADLLPGGQRLKEREVTLWGGQPSLVQQIGTDYPNEALVGTYSQGYELNGEGPAATYECQSQLTAEEAARDSWESDCLRRAAGISSPDTGAVMEWRYAIYRFPSNSVLPSGAGHGLPNLSTDFMALISGRSPICGRAFGAAPALGSCGHILDGDCLEGQSEQGKPLYRF